MNLHSLARTTPISRALLVDRITRQQWSVCEAAEAAGISERSAYKWLARYRGEGPGGLLDRSSRPRRSPARIPADWRNLILKLRRSRKTGPEIADKLGLPRSTVARVLRRAGLHRLKLLEPREPANRYERKRPGELIHLDIKKLARIAGRVGHRIHGDRSTRVYGAGWEFVHVASAHRQWSLLPLSSFSIGLSQTRHPASTYPPVSASDQRKSRAIHPDANPRMGLRAALHGLQATHQGSQALAQVLQSSATSWKPQPKATHQPCPPKRLNNVLRNHN